MWAILHSYYSTEKLIFIQNWFNIKIYFYVSYSSKINKSNYMVVVNNWYQAGTDLAAPSINRDFQIKIKLMIACNKAVFKYWMILQLIYKINQILFTLDNGPLDELPAAAGSQERCIHHVLSVAVLHDTLKDLFSIFVELLK